MLEVTRVLPEFSELKWETVEYDDGGNELSREEVSEIEHGLVATLSAKVENLEDGENVVVQIYEEGYEDPEKPLCRRLEEVRNGRIEDYWRVAVPRERLEELGEDDELKFVFCVRSVDKWIRSEDSATVQAVFAYKTKIEVHVDNSTEAIRFNLESTNGSYSQECSPEAIEEENDLVSLRFTDVKPGLEYKLSYKRGAKPAVEVYSATPFIKFLGDI